MGLRNYQRFDRFWDRSRQILGEPRLPLESVDGAMGRWIDASATPPPLHPAPFFRSPPNSRAAPECRPLG
ncbi:MAG: hypothetical protein HC895_18865 [Leptolyngbyaceae cyanobacterium SM1_3_5]|nr:hypothetical protein [Leptolyngbyaceae cyanobacterium SM1_3_5]